MPFDNVNLFPITAGVNTSDHLVLGGCDVVELAREFGSPLLVYDEKTLRAMCRQFVDGFADRYPNSRVAYASKAFLNPSIAKIVAEEGLGLDVVSGGELAVAMAAGVPIDKLYFHGNNKSPQELQFAVESGIGRVVVDNFYELRLLTDISRDRDVVQDVMVRLSPNVDPHTHVHTTTGILDSKFGFAIETGDAARAIGEALEAPNLDLVGVHFHLGSPIFELEPYSSAIDTILGFIAPFKEQGLDLREVSPGGGFAIGYVRDQPPPDIDHYAEAITDAMKSRCAELGFGEPRLTVEPGRSIVGRAGVALYTVGAIKDIPSVRKYVSVDGGMGDNIRPALYDAKYEAAVASRMSAPPEEEVTLAGKYCESGDVLIRGIRLPVLEAGDIIAIPSSGAYVPAMASSYNWNPPPAIVMVNDGSARLIRHRQSYQDMMAMDVL